MHIPVLLEEVLEGLKLGEGDRAIDATVGFGGHAKHMLDSVGDSGQILGIDCDEVAIGYCQKEFAKTKLQLVHENYGNIAQVCREHRFFPVKAILIDCGVSSVQLNNPERGFSFMQNGPLDMRMNRSSDQDLSQYLASVDEQELSDVLWTYGEERYSRRIAKSILKALQTKGINSTLELSEIIARSVPPHYRYRKIHPATRSFQALRIKINAELTSLQNALDHVAPLLAANGRLLVISFHSLEDRLIKQSFRNMEREGLGKRINKKVICPTSEELSNNPRSRSAKLRIFECNV